MLISPDRHKITCALRFGFKSSNNEAEYEALLVGLRLAKELKVGLLQIFSDSQLVVKHVTEKYQARGEKMVAYLRSAQVLLKSFSEYSIVQVPRADNTYVNALARLASTKEADLLGLIPMEHLTQPSIVEEDISELELDKLATSKLDTSELTPANHNLHELTVESDHELVPYEQPQRGEVNLTEPPPQLSEPILGETTLQT